GLWIAWPKKAAGSSTARAARSARAGRRCASSTGSRIRRSAHGPRLHLVGERDRRKLLPNELAQPLEPLRIEARDELRGRPHAELERRPVLVEGPVLHRRDQRRLLEACDACRSEELPQMALVHAGTAGL